MASWAVVAEQAGGTSTAVRVRQRMLGRWAGGTEAGVEAGSRAEWWIGTATETRGEAKGVRGVSTM